jgi:GNAT superfamily N-acetyltransferase
MNGCAMIRLARLEDAQALATLMEQLGYPTSSTHMRERLARLLQHPEYQTWVAEADGKVIGMAGACLGYFYEKHGVYGRLLALVVDGQMQHQGIGTSLVQAVEAWVQEQGGVSIAINSGNQRPAAHRFYQHLGYQLTGVRFVKALGSHVFPVTSSEPTEKVEPE